MDKIPLSSHQLFAFFIPGLIFVLPCAYCFYFTNVEPGSVDSFFKHYKDYEVMLSFLILFLALISGLIIDSIRNGICEWLMDKIFKDKKINKKGEEIRKKINWDFFFKAEEKKVKVLYDRYYNFYVFNINAAFSIVPSWVFLFLSIKICDLRIFLTCESIALIILLWESSSLRKEIIKITWDDIKSQP